MLKRTAMNVDKDWNRRTELAAIFGLTLTLTLSATLSACGPNEPSTTADTGGTTDAPQGDAGDALAADVSTSDILAPDVPGSVDATAADVPTPDATPTDVITADAIKCCPMETPTCDCFSVGGRSSPNGTCGGGVCDAAPVGWVKGVDKYGCPVWTSTSSESCIGGDHDAGPTDAGTTDGATTDSATTDAATIDSGVNADTGPTKPVVQCADNPPVFPAFDTSCKVAIDCAVVLHQINCCGTFVAAGVSQADKAAHEAAEQTCQAQYPKCKCVALATKADDGKTATKLDAFGVDCLAGVCKTLVK